jgi:hypothetical protein
MKVVVHSVSVMKLTMPSDFQILILVIMHQTILHLQATVTAPIRIRMKAIQVMTTHTNASEESVAPLEVREAVLVWLNFASGSSCRSTWFFNIKVSVVRFMLF